MLKLSRTLTLLALSMTGVCHSQDLASEPTAASSAYGQEPASVSYQDLKAKVPGDSIDNEGSPVTEEPLTVEESQETVPVKRKVVMRKKEKYSPKNDPEYLRSRGTSQHSTGVTMQVLGGAMTAVGVVLMVVNVDGLKQGGDDGYTVASESGETDDSGAALGFVAGELLTIGGVACLVVGGVIRGIGTRKLRRANEIEGASLFDRHRMNLLPMASIDRRMGGMVLTGTF